MAATCLHHISAMYIILPLLPFFSSHSTAASDSVNGSTGPLRSSVKAVKHHCQNNSNILPPTTDRVALSAIVFAGVHWTLWKTFASEMNPLVTFVIAVQREWQAGVYDEAAWTRAWCAIAGQFIGFILCILYIVTCIPKLNSQK